VRLDHNTRLLDRGRTILGGHPLRLLRLSRSGGVAFAEMLAGREPATAPEQALIQRLTDVGVVHPPPRATTPADVTVVIPVRDRADDLERCLATVGDGIQRVLVVDDGSDNPGAVAAVCHRYGAELLSRATSAGPAAARNDGLAVTKTGLIAFLDSDCVPAPGWLEILCGAITADDADVVAPRIRPLRVTSRHVGVVARFAASRSPLDLGPDPARVQPGARISYVPSAALLMRRSVLDAGYDATLRYGEDVDLIWRLHDAGWRIRYEPAAVVHHSEPRQLTGLLARRFWYGTSAGPLACRHPGRLSPAVLHLWPTLELALMAAGRPRAAVVASSVQLAVSAGRLAKVGLSLQDSAKVLASGALGNVAATGRMATMLAPVALLAGLKKRRTRHTVLTVTLVGPLRSWVIDRPGLDPIRWAALAIADDIAYGVGVWAGAFRSRTTGPLTPSVAFKGFSG
jgi:mycofactocin system glycosyltransferase